MSKQALDQQKQNSDTPWLEKSNWSEGVIRTNAKKSMMGGIVMATLWNAITWPMVMLIVPDELQDENYLALVALVFPLAGIGFAVTAFLSIRRYRKFGESSFQMASNPGIVGGQLVGVIKTNAKIQADESFRLTLNCIHRRVSGTGKNRHVSETYLWQSMHRITRSLDSNSANESAVPVQFTIPYDCQPCSPNQSSSERTYWKLEIAADQPGVDFHASFEVPVFKTEASNPDFQPDTSLLEGLIYQPTVDEIYRDARLLRQSTGNRLEMEFPFLRDLKGAISATLFLAIWLGITSLLAYGIGHPGSSLFGGAIGLFFVGMFGLFGLLFSLFVFELWLWRGSVTIDRNGMETKSGYLSLKQRFFNQDEIKLISFKRTMQSGGLIFYDLNLETTTGETITIGKRVANEATCRAIIQDIDDHLGRENPTQKSDVNRDSATSQSERMEAVLS